VFFTQTGRDLNEEREEKLFENFIMGARLQTKIVVQTIPRY
jgi:hypothetical protein